jgi:RNA polymerase primary sigma factor
VSDERGLLTAFYRGALFQMKRRRTGNREHKIAQSYLSTVQDEPLLSAEEESTLAAAIAQGDKNALRRMVETNMRLVVRIAQEYVGKGLTLDDLIGEGNLALVRAAEQFEPRHGARFSTYASLWIKQAIQRALFDTTGMIRLPEHVLRLLGRWRKAERALGRELARKPSFNEVASRLGLNESQRMLVAKAQQARRVRLESTVEKEAARWSLVEPSDPYGPPDLAVEGLDDKLVLRSRLEGLTDRERAVLSLRYGLDQERPLTLCEIGDRLGINRQSVKLAELEAVRKLRGDRLRAASAPSRRSIARVQTLRARTYANSSSTSATESTGAFFTSSPHPDELLPPPTSVPMPMPSIGWDQNWAALNATIAYNP